MKKENMSMEELRILLLKYHKEKNYEIFDSFPIKSDNDPTTLFVSAAMSPFKNSYLENGQKNNYALIQKCLRIGKSSEAKNTKIDPYCHTFFEMFGSGTFNTSYEKAVKYMLELLTAIGIETSNFYYTIPVKGNFRKALSSCGIDKKRMFSLTKNEFFWQEWKFGKLGLLGHGLTVVYARTEKGVTSINQMASSPNEFIELLNLIRIDEKEKSEGKIVPIGNPGFDLGVGIERIAAIIQNCNNYQIDSMAPLVKITEKYLNDFDITNETLSRTITDRLRSICILTEEGILPAKQKQGYILRKLIRETLTSIWTNNRQITSIKELSKPFCDEFSKTTTGHLVKTNDVVQLVEKETNLYIKSLQRGKRLLKRKTSIGKTILQESYGLPPELIPIIDP